MKPFAILSILFLLAACGADGKPVAPAAKSGISISGDAQIGAVIK